MRLLHYVDNFHMMLLGYSGVYILQFFKKKKTFKKWKLEKIYYKVRKGGQRKDK